jgi:ABC-type branched-subunit amino acid transport system substrate-binding protein
MRSSAARRTAVAAAALLLIAGCGGGGQRPLRIGVIVDCVGAFHALEDQELSGAQLPLLERGARPAGKNPSDGVQAARAGGRLVEIVRGCSESGEFATITQVARQLVETAHVDVVVAGGPFPVDGLPLRDLARRYPDVAFVAAASGPREVTLQRPAANVYRFEPDFGQGVAGLATYAYRELGWRRAALVLDDWVVGWGSETTFVREFCALGGRVVKRVALAGPQTPAKVVAQIPRGADGVAVFGSGMSQTPDLLQALARRGAAHLVLGPDVIGDPTLVRGATALRGVVAASYLPSPQASPEMAAYLRAYAKTYPGIPAGAALNALVVSYRSAVEAVLDAFEQTGGDRGARLRERLAHLQSPLLGQPLRMDDHRQAVVSSHLVRLGVAGAGGMPELEPVRSIAGVDQSVGGLVPADYVPTSKGQACRRVTPPPWAR